MRNASKETIRRRVTAQIVLLESIAAAKTEPEERARLAVRIAVAKKQLAENELRP